jgi:asparagine synthase (glutamine-hydrolysing)
LSALDGRVFLGHRRLKVIDISDQANQPLTSPCGRYSLVFNGEIYNYRELHSEVLDDWVWRSSGDSEVLLGLFARFGRDALPMLNGMFAFAVLDRETRRLFLARDRFGIKPLYHAQVNGTWYFASEIAALLPLLPTVREDKDTIRTYLETGAYDFGPWTFFRDVQALEPGCWMEINLDSGEAASGRWYQLHEGVPDLSSRSEDEIEEQLAGLVHSAIRDHLVADVKVGLNVSGGVDSSVLVNVAKQYVSDIQLFTQDYEPPYSEAEWVRDVAQGCHLHLLQLRHQDIDGVLPEVVEVEGEPFGGVTVCGYNHLYRSADKQGVTVLLDGNGADECLLGYRKYHDIYLHQLKGSSAYKLAQQEYSTFWGAPPVELLSPSSTGIAIDGSLSICADAVSQSFRSGSQVRQLPRVDVFQDAVKNAAATDLLYTKIPRGLRFNDRISMSKSKELRVPFLDHRLVEFAFGIPTQMLLNRDGTKALFRKVAGRWIPGRLSMAAKRSVQSPQREWLANEWRGLVSGILDSESFLQRGWVDPGQAQAIYRDYLDGQQQNSFFIWQWLNLELWARAYLD